MFYLIVENDVDDGIPTDGAFSAEQRNRTHSRTDGPAGEFDQANNCVRKPRNLVGISISFIYKDDLRITEDVISNVETLKEYFMYFMY